MKRVLVVLAALVLTEIPVLPAMAESLGEGGTVTVPGSGSANGSGGYDPNGINARASNPPAPASVPSQGSSGSQGYHYVPLLPVIPLSQLPCPSGTTQAYDVWDPNGNYLGVQCVTSPPASPEALAQQASSSQPWPDLAIMVNPGTGMAGIASWFWIGGSPALPDATATVSGLTVTVRATLIDVIWAFGDGQSFDSGTDLGQPYPAPSDIQHVYEVNTARLPGGRVTLQVLLRYRVDYSVNGGPFSQLGFKSRPFTRSYTVDQLQPQAVSER